MRPSYSTRNCILGSAFTVVIVHLCFLFLEWSLVKGQDNPSVSSFSLDSDEQTIHDFRRNTGQSDIDVPESSIFIDVEELKGNRIADLYSVPHKGFGKETTKNFQSSVKPNNDHSLKEKQKVPKRPPKIMEGLTTAQNQASTHHTSADTKKLSRINSFTASTDKNDYNLPSDDGYAKVLKQSKKIPPKVPLKPRKKVSAEELPPVPSATPPIDVNGYSAPLGEHMYATIGKPGILTASSLKNSDNGYAKVFKENKKKPIKKSQRLPKKSIPEKLSLVPPVGPPIDVDGYSVPLEEPIYSTIGESSMSTDSSLSHTDDGYAKVVKRNSGGTDESKSIPPKKPPRLYLPPYTKKPDSPPPLPKRPNLPGLNNKPSTSRIASSRNEFSTPAIPKSSYSVIDDFGMFGKSPEESGIKTEEENVAIVSHPRAPETYPKAFTNNAIPPKLLELFRFIDAQARKRNVETQQFKTQDEKCHIVFHPDVLQYKNNYQKINFANDLGFDLDLMHVDLIYNRITFSRGEKNVFTIQCNGYPEILEGVVKEMRRGELYQDMNAFILRRHLVDTKIAYAPKLYNVEFYMLGKRFCLLSLFGIMKMVFWLNGLASNKCAAVDVQTGAAYLSGSFSNHALITVEFKKSCYDSKARNAVKSLGRLVPNMLKPTSMKRNKEKRELVQVVVHRNFENLALVEALKGLVYFQQLANPWSFIILFPEKKASIQALDAIKDIRWNDYDDVVIQNLAIFNLVKKKPEITLMEVYVEGVKKDYKNFSAHSITVLGTDKLGIVVNGMEPNEVITDFNCIEPKGVIDVPSLFSQGTSRWGYLLVKINKKYITPYLKKAKFVFLIQKRRISITPSNNVILH